MISRSLVLKRQSRQAAALIKAAAVKPAEGWGLPKPRGVNPGTVGWHYFRDGRSLCGRWAAGGELCQGNDDSPDNCQVCRKRLAKEVAGGKRR